MNKKQLQSEQTKKRLAELSRELFASKGYKATSIEDIVAATGSSKGNIYYHFKSKEGLFQYLLDEWDREWEQQWEAKSAQYATFRQKLHGLAEHLVENDLNHPLMKATSEFLSTEWENSEVRELAEQYIARHVEQNRRMLEQAIQTGELAPGNARTLAIVLESMLIGLSEMSRRIDAAEMLEVYRKAVDVFLDGTAKIFNYINSKLH